MAAPTYYNWGELNTPEINDDQVLVEVVATSVNPIDRRLRSGELQEFISRTFPVIPGWDLAGRVVKGGPQCEPMAARRRGFRTGIHLVDPARQLCRVYPR